MIKEGYNILMLLYLFCRYVNEPLKLGKCKGNKFTIVLR